MEGPVGVPANPDRYHWQFLAIGTNQVSLDPVETPILVSAVFRRVDPYRQLADTGHQFIGVFLSKSCLSEKLMTCRPKDVKRASISSVFLPGSWHLSE
jgi:hypothetical protein